MYVLWAFSVVLLALGFSGRDPEPPNAPHPGPDITLKTRTTSTFHSPAATPIRIRTDAVYISGKRERRDFSWDGVAGASGMDSSTIRDCTLHRWIILAHQPRTYTVHPFPDLEAERATAERIAKAKADIKAGRIKPVPIPPDAPVTTIETIDTGERREIAGFTLRHLRQTERTSGSSHSLAHRTRAVTRDGWYVNLPDVSGCGEPSSATGQGQGYAMLRPALDVPARVDFKGNVPPHLGTPVETIITTEYGDGTMTVEKTELVEFSRAPVDATLFEIPADYRDALHTPYGGRDMMQPDTLFNRARAWWWQLW